MTAKMVVHNRRSPGSFESFLVCLIVAFSAQSWAAGSTTTLAAHIIDDVTGLPLAARVAITNADGKFLEVEGAHPHVQYLGKRWCYLDGSFIAMIPSFGGGIEIRRGFETRPLLDIFPEGADRNL